MTMTDPISDLITRIRNGQRTSKSVVESPNSRLRVNVLDALQREGYIRGYSVENIEGKNDQSTVRIELKYHEGAPVIREIHRVSRPGRRVYSKIKELTPVYNGLGISILSTPRGILSDGEARAQNVGGEVLCTVF
ncbi:MAG: 30S ribosomal protein S8 [Rhodospirillaceae bacterium]|nr:30S ribosomal protein S8 [Rhodospirillaceae bacterium]|tara:strand:+ start:1450 stop:1854 length:405 start_codon:yes stop_codon:yes gene_type:complete